MRIISFRIMTNQPIFIGFGISVVSYFYIANQPRFIGFRLSISQLTKRTIVFLYSETPEVDWIRLISFRISDASYFYIANQPRLIGFSLSVSKSAIRFFFSFFTWHLLMSVFAVCNANQDTTVTLKCCGFSLEWLMHLFSWERSTQQ